MGRHEPPRGYGDYGDNRGRDDHGYDRGHDDYRDRRDHGGHADRSYGRDSSYGSDAGYGRRSDYRDDARSQDHRSSRDSRSGGYDRSGDYDRSPGYERSTGYERSRGSSHGGDDDPYGGYDYRSSRASSGRASVGSASVGTASAKASVSVEDVKAERMSKMEAAYEKHGGTRRKGGRRRPGGEDLDEDARKLLKKKRKRKRILIALGCVVLMLTGVGIVGTTMLFESVPLPDDIAMPESNAVMFANGKDEMARIGSAYREKVDIKALPKHVKFAIIAAEDQTFYQNDGVDFKGVLRAAWNNITGGDTQGASTITQQYAGIAAKFRDESTYGRKIQEAVMAMKLDDEYEKDDILGFYMNLVPFGRTAEGIGAAAKAYFGKPAAELTVAEAALLAGQIKSPDGSFDPRDPKGVGNAEAVLGRWNYVLDSMVKIGELPADQRAALTEVPKTLENTSNPANVGLDKDTGFVSHGVVLRELQDNYGISQEELESKGGYTIVTSIDPDLQKAAREAASTEGKVLKGQPENLRAALVAVDPTNGEIVAYYGGSDTGSDLNRAGYKNMHPPGSSFKVFTMLTALNGSDKKSAASLESLWDASSPRKFDDRDTPVSNSDNDNSCGKDCKLINAIRKSLNTPTYSMTKTFGAENVVATARDMGITRMVGAAEEPCKSRTVVFAEETDKSKYTECFDNEVGFGQYEVAVQDMAAAFATLANKGERYPAHVIRKVIRGGEEIKPIVDMEPKQVIPVTVAQDAAHVLKTIHPNNGGTTLPNGSEYAGKTGTWEKYCDDKCNQNSQNWYAAFIPQLAAAAWLGDKKDENGSLKDKNGNPTFGSQISGDVWLTFMKEAIRIKDLKATQFDPPANIGSAANGDHATPIKPSNSPSSPPPDPGDKPSQGPQSPSPGGSPQSPKPDCTPWIDPNCKKDEPGAGG